jgi:hypothetical protein
MNYFPLWCLKTSKIIKFLNFEFVFSLEGKILPKILTLPTKVFMDSLFGVQVST